MTAIFTRFPTALIALLATIGLHVALENAHAQGTVESDRAALVAIHNATDGPNWDHRIGWLTSDPLYEWANVVTDSDGRVTWLALNDNNLTGELPPELGNLSKLQLLRLHDNNLTGEIPSQLRNLTELVDLALGENPGHPGNNEFAGSIPSRLGGLSSLVQLNLGENMLSGPIPPELGNLASLQQLYLYDNGLTGEIPSKLGDLSYETHEDTRYTSGNHRVRVARCCSGRRNREELSPPAASRRRRGVAICPVGHECFAVSEPLYLQRVRCSVEQVQ